MIVRPESSPSIFGQAILGVTLHPGQIQWLENHATVKVACCGRRWGKSFAEAVDLLWFACAYPETAQFLLAPTADQSRTIFRYAERLLLGAPLLAPYVHKIVQSPFPMIELKTGATIHARSAGDTGQNVRSHGADRLVLDEAAYIPEVAIDALSPLLATSAFAQRAYISTAFGKNFFWELFQRGQSDEVGYASFQFPSSTSPHVSKAYLDQQRREMTALAYAVEYEAQFAEDQNAVFPWPLIQAAIDHEMQLGPQPGRSYVIGYDPAKWHDRSGVVVLDVTREPWQVAEIADISGRDYLAQATAIQALHAKYARAPVLLDATSHDQMLEHLRHEKVTAEGFKFTNEAKGELISGLAIALEQGRLRIPNHQDLIRELAYYRYELTAAGNVKLGAPNKAGHHDDLVTALALAAQQAKTPRIAGNRVAVSGPRPTIPVYPVRP